MRGCWKPYNTALEKMASRFATSDVHGEFWARVVKEGGTEGGIGMPVCDEEVAGSDKTRALAESWLQQHRGGVAQEQQGGDGSGGEVVGEVAGSDDEMEEMG